MIYSELLAVVHARIARAGLASAWIHRRHAQGGFGATRPPDQMPKNTIFGSRAWERWPKRTDKRRGRGVLDSWKPNFIEYPAGVVCSSHP